MYLGAKEMIRKATDAGRVSVLAVVQLFQGMKRADNGAIVKASAMCDGLACPVC